MWGIGDGLVTRAKELWAGIRKQTPNVILWIFGGVMAFLLANVFISPTWSLLSGPDAYIVYLVGDFSVPQLLDLRSGFKEKQQDLQIDKVHIKFIYLAAKAEEAAQVSSKLATKNDTLMVIGHMNTTASKTALKSYMNADPPIPVILAVETNPELLPADRTKYYPVFRLSPTDDKQAEIAAQFIVNQKGTKGIWVMEDGTANPIYTRYLASEFVRQVAKKDLSQRAEEKRVASLQPGQTEMRSSATAPHEAKVMLWTTSPGSPPSPDVLLKLGINWVFYSGSTENCVILAQQIAKLFSGDSQAEQPTMLLSNACVSRDLLDLRNDNLNAAFLTHPMLPNDYKKDGFKVRGVQSFALLQDLIGGADKIGRDAPWRDDLWHFASRIIGFHKVADARNAIRAYMQKAIAESETFDLGDHPYTFTADGTAKEINFHLWHVKTGADGQQKEYEEFD